ncbi:hypothetical protein L1O03_06065 [Corynebacterium uropygiale]|uniref:Uncharacterized protein n=1 Tax=Corynebacterium uropygiale TaxID=1775911 RepID=A0A9X1QP42_9CORY|nr:FtsX-like permease family protein [Corynebacterium uropygiale]MCF4006744.1 hypothetical protein [Corynebacterium uropygiale]
MRTILRPLVRTKKSLIVILLLVAIPAAILAGAATWWTSDARFHDAVTTRNVEMATYVGARCHQDETARTDEHCTYPDPAFRPQHARQADGLQSVLGEDSSLALSLSFPSEISTDSDSVTTDTQQLDASLLPEGYRATSATGRLPGPGEIMLSPSAASTLSVQQGDTVRLQPTGWDEHREPITLTVSSTKGNSTATVLDGTVVDAADLPTALPEEWSATWILSYGGEVSPAIIPALNDEGFLLTSPHFARPIDGGVGVDNIGAFLLVFAIILGVVAVLLISPAFTVLATRNIAMFSLLASQGASPSQIRRGLITFGALAGLVGGVVGTALGVAVGVGSWLSVNPMWWPILPWTAMAVIIVVCVLASALLAAIPAVVIARMALSQALAGAAPDRLRHFQRWMLIGPALAILGIIVGAVFRHFTLGGTGWAIGILLLLLGLAGSTPLCVWLCAAALRRGPLALRLSRQALVRQSLRSVSVTAALAAVVGVAGMFYTSNADIERSMNDTSIPVYSSPTILLEGSGTEHTDGLDTLRASAEEVLPGARSVELTSVTEASISITDGTPCSVDGKDHLNPERAPFCRMVLRGPKADTGISSIIVASSDIAEVFAMSPEEQAAAVDTLNHGGVLISRDAQDYFGGLTGQIPLTIDLYADALNDSPPTQHDTPRAAAVLPPSRDIILSPQLAERYGMSHEVNGVLYHHTGLSAEQMEKVTAQLREKAEQTLPPSYVRELSRSDTTLRSGVILLAVLTLIILVVSALSLGLARPELRRQYQLLDALGSQPGFARRVNACYGALTGVVAAVMGVLFMLITVAIGAHATVTDIDGVTLVPGTLQMLAGPIGIMSLIILTAPLGGALVGWLGTGKITPMLSRPD